MSHEQLSWLFLGLTAALGLTLITSVYVMLFRQPRYLPSITHLQPSDRRLKELAVRLVAEQLEALRQLAPAALRHHSPHAPVLKTSPEGWQTRVTTSVQRLGDNLVVRVTAEVEGGRLGRVSRTDGFTLPGASEHARPQSDVTSRQALVA
jgi:hypothetical protein